MFKRKAITLLLNQHGQTTFPVSSKSESQLKGLYILGIKSLARTDENRIYQNKKNKICPETGETL